MRQPPPPSPALRWWVLLRLPAPIVALVLVALVAPSAVGGWVGERLTRLAYAHGTVKMALLGWQSMMLREWQLLAFVAVSVVGGAGVALLRGAPRALGVAIVGVAMLGLLRPLTAWTIPVALLWLAVATMPAAARPWRLAAWIPGVELLFPVPVGVALGASRVTMAGLGAFAGLTVGATWVVADTYASFWAYEKRVFAPWPDSLVDPRVTTLMRAPAGTKSDFHDVDIVGDRVVVVLESSAKLLNVPRAGAVAEVGLPPQWGELFGLVMDSETDPATGLTYHLAGPHTFVAHRWDGGGWTQVAQSAPLADHLHHMYVHLLVDRPERTLVAFSVGTKNPHEDNLMIELDTPSLQAPRVHRLRLADGSGVPTIRDFAWVPPLGRFVLAPDFGDRLYLATPGSDLVEPWMEMPTLNGRISWVPELGRLVVPVPNRPELWFVDPARGVIDRRLPTQPGVRTVGVDVRRGLFVTASVLTGRVLVQRLDDGRVVDRFGTLMPMSRNIVLDLDRGEAVLSTWTALYRIPYAAP